MAGFGVGFESEAVVCPAVQARSRRVLCCFDPESDLRGEGSTTFCSDPYKGDAAVRIAVHE